MSTRGRSVPSATALALILAPGAAAAAEPIKLSLGGYILSGITVRDQTNVAVATPGSSNRGTGDDRNYTTASTTNAAGATIGVPTTTELGRTDQLWEGELWFMGETTLDNGIKVGVNIQLEAYTSADQFDEHYVYVQGGFGRVVAGAENSAPYTMHYTAPSPTGQLTADEDRNLSPLRTPPSNAAGNSVTTFSQLTSDANKVTYYTPRFAPGFQFGLSYAPDDDAPQGTQTVNGAGSCRGGCAFDAGNGISDTGQTNHHHFVEGATNFVRSFNGVNVAFDLGFGYAQLEKQSRSASRDRLGKDRVVLSSGFNVGYAGWTIGGAAAWDNKGLQGPNSRYDFTFGVTYGAGPWLIGFDAGYTIAQDGQALQAAGAGNATPVLVRRSNDTLFYSEVGASYKLGPGIKLFSVVNVAKWGGNDTATEESTGVAWSTGVQLNF